MSVVSQYRPSPGMVAVADGTHVSSHPFSLDQVPPRIRAEVAQGRLAHATTTLDGTSYLLVGTQPRRGLDVFFFFSRQELIDDTQAHAVILGGGWLAVIAVALIVGRRVARRTLRPVADGARAARAVAAGLLDTRLASDPSDEFGEWAAAFNEMAAALQAKIAREERFAAVVAHELRNPLATLAGATSVLEDDLEELPPGARHAAKLLITDCSRLCRLVDELLEISGLQKGREVVDADLVDLRLAVEAAVALRGYQAKVGVAGDAVEVETDRRRLDRIVGNLVENAVRHGQGAEVRVTVKQIGDGAVIAVSDRGPGIPPDHLPHLFTPFYKAASGSDCGGAGLGLAIAAEHARLLGADIRVVSELGQGSEFVLRLPNTPPRTNSDKDGLKAPAQVA